MNVPIEDLQNPTRFLLDDFDDFAVAPVAVAGLAGVSFSGPQPGFAYANDSSVASDVNSGTNRNTSCTDNGKDKHLYSNYNFNLPATAVIQGIEVRLDARADSASGSPKTCVQISWDGGITWTTVKSTTTLRTTEGTYILGSASEILGRTWVSGDFNNPNFRIRVIEVSSNPNREFFLDYIAVNITYQP